MKQVQKRKKNKKRNEIGINLSNRESFSDSKEEEDSNTQDDTDSRASVGTGVSLGTQSDGFDPEDKEDEEDYKKGGYHRVHLGDTIKRYKVIKKLGWGHFSTVWLVQDRHNKQLALKIVKSAKRYTEAAEDEIKLLECVAEGDPENKKSVVRMWEHFVHKGPNGNHVCMIFEVLGSNLLDLIKLYNYQGIPLPLVKSISKQVLIGLDYLHTRCEMIHTDLKPENVLLDHSIKKYIGNQAGWESLWLTENAEASPLPQPPTPENGKSNGKANPQVVNYKQRQMTKYPLVKIADLGLACWTYKHFTDDIQTRQYRSPEVIIGAKWHTTVDMWSMACMVFELATGDLLFEPKQGKNHDKSDDHLALMMELLGRMPKGFLNGGKHTKDYFDRHGELRAIKKLEPWSLLEVLQEKYHFPQTDAEDLASFLLPMLDYTPEKRTTARECLEHRWLAGVLP